MTDLESQRDELEALQSIYNKDEFKVNEHSDLPGGQFFAYIDLPPNFEVVYKLIPRYLREKRDIAATSASGSAVRDAEIESFSIEFLPPLVLYVTLPPNYPSEAKPNYLLSCKWLTRGKLSILCRHLDQLWEENRGMEVLYIWTQFLKEESLNFLNIETSLDVSVIYTKQVSYLERKNKKQKNLNLLKMQEAKKIEDEKTKGVNNMLLNDQNQKIDCKLTAGKENARRAVIVTTPPKVKTSEPSSAYSLQVEPSVKNVSTTTAAGMVYCSSNDSKQPQLEIQAAGTTYVKPDYSAESKLHRSQIEELSLHQHENQTGSKYVSEKTYHGGYAKNHHSQQQNTKHQSAKQYKDQFSYSNDCSNVNIRNQRSQNSKYRYQSDKFGDQQKCDEDPSPFGECGRPEKLSPDDRTVLDLPLTESVCLTLQHYNQEQRVVVFRRSLQECTVCFSSKLGADCIQFDKCGHIFCKVCITGYFEVQIRDGNVKSLKCLEDKCDTEANPSQVKQVLSAETFAKYDAALLAATLDTMSDIVYCPRRSCQYPVSLEPEETMGCCPSCQYVFCIYCKMVYHGVEPCRLKSEEQQRLVNEYHTGSSDARSQLEKRYGRRQLQRLVDTVLSEQWVSANSQNCPRCSVSIEKSSGCNKMACWRCNTYFCWLCQAELSHASPYLHFNNPASRCFNRLFEGVDPNEDDEDDDDFWLDLDEL